jgi:hypothetical protein
MEFLTGKGFYCEYGPKTAANNDICLSYYVRGGWDGEIAETWGDAVITKPVAVSTMHAWLKAHPGAFSAAIADAI